MQSEADWPCPVRRAAGDDAIVSKTLDGVIQSWNASAERLFGYTAAQAIGRHISLVIPLDRIAEEDRIIADLKPDSRSNISRRNASGPTASASLSR